jgi:hypothetical protein
MPTTETQIDIHDISLLAAQKPNDIITKTRSPGKKVVKIDDTPMISRIASKLSNAVERNKSTSPSFQNSNHESGSIKSPSPLDHIKEKNVPFE